MFFKKYKLFIYIFLFLFIFPFFLKYLNNYGNIIFLKNLYFNLPIFFSNKKICGNYDVLKKKYLDKTISFSLIDNKGNIISEYNSEIARIPASNLKLLSTGYVVSKYNNFYSLKTNLYKDNNNNYLLKGSGDPDLSLNDIQVLLNNIKYSQTINITLFEVKKNTYWPEGWTSQDKLYKYGSPITKLAINSNSSRYMNINGLKNYIYDYLISKFPNSEVNIFINDRTNDLKKKTILVDSINSNPILSLVTLANSESHNFTSESLFKNASNTWNNNSYIKLYFWLKNKGLPVKNLYIADASGLSRNNKVTTNLIASFLHKMKFNNKFEFYASTLSVMGMRGTLAKSGVNNELKGKFFGKTGTLSNVFSLSGYLNKKNKIYSVSIIQNSNFIDKNRIFNFLSDLNEIEECK
tara:strand:+ start:106 stop:1329 length:1224 start_codon:yes stop_codon:yes gene_type:complete